jgi:hypothetical protein
VGGVVRRRVIPSRSGYVHLVSVIPDAVQPDSISILSVMDSTACVSCLSALDVVMYRRS